MNACTQSDNLAREVAARNPDFYFFCVFYPSELERLIVG